MTHQANILPTTVLHTARKKFHTPVNLANPLFISIFPTQMLQPVCPNPKDFRSSVAQKAARKKKKGRKCRLIGTESLKRICHFTTSLSERKCGAVIPAQGGTGIHYQLILCIFSAKSDHRALIEKHWLLV